MVIWFSGDLVCTRCHAQNPVGGVHGLVAGKGIDYAINLSPCWLARHGKIGEYYPVGWLARSERPAPIWYVHSMFRAVGKAAI